MASHASISRERTLGRGLIALLLAAAGCSDSARLVSGVGALFESPVGPELPALFAADRAVQIEIELAPGDWDALRREGRDLLGLYSGTQFNYEYTYFDATVTIDGVRHEHAGLRKKGYWGSLSVVRPSLKIDLDQYNPDEAHLGVEKLTLNNDRGDPSRTHECMAYDLFARAGLPASRCNLAHVVVNGVDLGTYSNVESIDKKMLARAFPSNDGNLYEGQLTDLIRGDADRLELKTNESDNDRSDLNALVEALEASDAELIARLGAVLDIDRFRDFWAMELLAGQWDGYAHNANNYQLYRNPETGLFQFLPWGTDNAFEHANPRGRVYATGRVAARLYALPEQQALFRARLAELTDTAWNTGALLEHIDRVALLAPDALPRAIADERSFIASRAERLRETFDDPPPAPRRRSTSRCRGITGDVGGSFVTVFGDGLHVDPGEYNAWLSLDGEPVTELTWTGQSNLERGLPDLVPGVRLFGTQPDGTEITLQLYVEPSQFRPGMVRFHGGETYGDINVKKKDQALRYVAVFGDGGVDLVEAEARVGAPVSGSFTGRIYQFECAPR